MSGNVCKQIRTVIDYQIGMGYNQKSAHIKDLEKILVGVVKLENEVAVKDMIDSLKEMYDYMEKNGDDELCIELDSRVTNSDFETAEVSIKRIRDILSLLSWKDEDDFEFHYEFYEEKELEENS